MFHVQRVGRYEACKSLLGLPERRALYRDALDYFLYHTKTLLYASIIILILT